MKIKFAIDNHTAQVRVRSKSKSKKTKLLSESIFREQSYAASSGRNSSIEKGKIKESRQRSFSRLHCDHKSKKSKENFNEDEYYTTTSQRKEWQRQKQEILRENEKLRRENKVLNDYFSYLECKELLSSKQREKVFSFKEMQEVREFQGGQSKAHKTSITKPNSRMQYLEEFY